ncbi:N-acetylmuramoyl-L-alanine amidase [Mobiluncus mulieris]|uniref:N-acetylmuramoyl-L-alanine amidase n=1 Tax=Mobiluncus mulieris TaxID=2052 RepID=A0A7Y0U0P1_9ACTO|nr:peptidoglycan recognition family protein [Mobiluncus mulieris]NMW64781.1 N-acetylmuramoyl-L-alanine amidase [Mobiluncus mulieris]
MKSPNHSSRKGNPIRFIVVHWWGNPAHHRDADPIGVIRHLCTPAGDKSVSAHAVVWPGGVTELIDPQLAAWHAMQVNPISIGIECWPWDWQSPRDLVNATLENLAQQVAHYYHFYPHLAKERLHAHSEHVATDCPGDYYRARLDQIHQRALEIYQGKKTQKPERKENPQMIIFRTPDGVCTLFINGEMKQNPSAALLQGLQDIGVPVLNITPEDLAFLKPSPDMASMPGRVRNLLDLATDNPKMPDWLKRSSLLGKIQDVMGIRQRQN